MPWPPSTLPAEDLNQAVAEWERRRNATLEQLEGLPVVRPAGGWSLLLGHGSPGGLAARHYRELWPGSELKNQASRPHVAVIPED